MVLTLSSVLTGFVATPLVLRWLGSERLGAFRAASDWLGYLGLLEMGLGGALLALMARALGTGDDLALRAVITAGLRAFRKVALWMLVGGGLLALAIPKLVPVSAGLTGDLRAGVAIGSLGFFLVALAPLRTLVDAQQRGYVLNLISLIQSLITTALVVCLAYTGFGVRGQFAASIIGVIALNGLLAWNNWKRILEFARSKGALDSETLARAEQELWTLNRPTLIFNICGRVGLLTDNIVIALFLGPAAVVPFFISQRLAQLAQGQLQSIGNSTWAALAELHVSGHAETFGRRLTELTKLVMVMGVAAMVPIVSYNYFFVQLWVGQTQFGGTVLTAFASVNGILLSLFSLWGWVFSGTGRVARLTRLNVAAATVNISASLVCTKFFGLVGPLIGTTVSLVGVILWWEPLLLRKEFGVALRGLLEALLRPVAVAIPYAVLVWILAHRYPPRGWMTLGLEMGTAGAAFMPLAWLLVLNREEQQLWTSRLRSFV